MSLRKVKNGKKNYSNKYLLLIAVVFILLGGLLLMVIVNLAGVNRNGGRGMKSPESARLTDPDLIFVNRFFAGICSDGKGSMGGCRAERFIYRSGLVIDESEFISNKGEREVEPPVRRHLTSIAVDKIIQAIRESRLMKDSCPSERVMDVTLEYRINPDGEQKVLQNYPPHDCLEKLRTIDGVVDSVLE